MLAIAPVVAAPLISGGIQALSGLLGGFGKSKNKRKAMELLMEALQNARLGDAQNRQITSRNQAGIQRIQNQATQNLAGLGRQRQPINLSSLFAAGSSNPLQAQPGAVGGGTFSPTGRPTVPGISVEELARLHGGG